jgi:hypothetical protein
LAEGAKGTPGGGADECACGGAVDAVGGRTALGFEVGRPLLPTLFAVQGGVVSA